jgi:hypothetical protein
MTRSRKWAIGSAVALVAAVTALLNVWAAADLGYDAYPGGAAIIARWAYAMLGFIVLSAACGLMAIRTR